MTPQDRNYTNDAREGRTNHGAVEKIEKDDPRSIHYRGQQPNNRAGRRAYLRAIGNPQMGRVAKPYARMGKRRSDV